MRTGLHPQIKSEGMLRLKTLCKKQCLSTPEKSPPGLAGGLWSHVDDSATDLEIPVHPRENLAIGLHHMARRFSALVLPRMLSSFDSNESFWPSLSEPMPARSTALMCTNTSLPPSSG